MIVLLVFPRVLTEIPTMSKQLHRGLQLLKGWRLSLCSPSFAGSLADFEIRLRVAASP